MPTITVNVPVEQHAQLCAEALQNQRATFSVYRVKGSRGYGRVRGRVRSHEKFNYVVDLEQCHALSYVGTCTTYSDAVKLANRIAESQPGTAVRLD